MRLLYCPCPDPDTAATLGRQLVEAQLAACVNLIPVMRSIYAWQGTVCDDQECLLLAKTSADLETACRQQLISSHPYETPCVLSLTPSAVNEQFGDWLAQQLSS